ncbi:MAG: ABC transporter ATP-binding protein [Candidatus Riflebacteria bacterium]|nr:ABC transporter ATP-binding protein [Candidatus Riflebacteria bacterium]
MELSKNETILSVENLHFAYSSNRYEVLRGVNCDIKKGERVAILGSNGAGKSTFFSLITGILNGYTGSIKLNGQEIQDLDRMQIAESISFVPQKHEPLFPFSVKDFIMMGRYSKIGALGNPTEKDTEAVMRAAEETGAIKYIDRPYSELSGGEIQLAIIARALAQETEILILDEPNNHLDFKNQFTIFNLICDISKKRNVTLIMSLHNPNDVILFAERAIVFNNGVVAADGAVSKILDTKLLSEVFGVNAVCLEEGGYKAFLPQSLKKG